MRVLDVSKAEEVEQWIADAFNEFGRLDGAANVAGRAGGSGDTTVQTMVCYRSRKTQFKSRSLSIFQSSRIIGDGRLGTHDERQRERRDVLYASATIKDHEARRFHRQHCQCWRNSWHASQCSLFGQQACCDRTICICIRGAWTRGCAHQHRLTVRVCCQALGASQMLTTSEVVQ